jgi:hypothetical protein
MSTSTSEATSDYSTANRGSRGPSERPGRTRVALSGLAIVAAVVLGLASFLTLFRITTGEVAIRSYSGFDQHSVAMLLLAIAVVPMALGALRGARPAMFAVALIGVVALVVAFTVDLPAALDEGTLAVTYEGASAEPAIGFFVETFAAALLLVAGGLMLLVPQSSSPSK